MRERWTDERMDDLSEGMHREFDGVCTEIRAVRTDLGEEIRAVRTELGEEIRTVRTELRQEIRAVRTEIGTVRTELKEDIGGLRGEMNELRRETNAGFRDLNRTMILGFGSIVASVMGSAIAAILAHAL